MSASPQLAPARLLTVAEYAELGEDDQHRWELQEGSLVMSPSPVPRHMIAIKRLSRELDRQVPDGLEVVPDIDVDLELVPPDHPGFSRRPDLVVVERSALERVEREGGLLRAREIVLAVEIISSGSRRTERVIKHGEYADAGIGHYWVVDLGPPVSLTVCHLAGQRGYQDAAAVTGVFTSSEPFPVRLELDALR